MKNNTIESIDLKFKTLKAETITALSQNFENQCQGR